MTSQLQPQQRRAVDLRVPAIEKYAYCLCLHVKPATIFIAVFKLARALIVASSILTAEFSGGGTSSDLSSGFDDRHRPTSSALNLVSRLIIASASAVGIYAVVSGRAALLMPLYAILLVDFFFSLPTFYNKDFEPTLTDNYSDMRGYPEVPNHYNSRYSLMLFSTISMILKIYMLCVVWKCYRYLRLIELVTPIRLAEILPHIHQHGPPYPIVRVLGSTDSGDLTPGLNIAPPPYESLASSMKPPNYEEAMKSGDSSFGIDSSGMSSQQHQGVQQGQRVLNHQQPEQHTVVFANSAAENQSSSIPKVDGTNHNNPENSNYPTTEAVSAAHNGGSMNTPGSVSLVTTPNPGSARVVHDQGQA